MLKIGILTKFNFKQMLKIPIFTICTIVSGHCFLLLGSNSSLLKFSQINPHNSIFNLNIQESILM